MNEITVLLVGGNADGVWVKVAHNERTVEMPASTDFSKPIPSLNAHCYRISHFALYGYSMPIGVLDGTRDVTRAILKAILQRDVFDHIAR